MLKTLFANVEKFFNILLAVFQSVKNGKNNNKNSSVFQQNKIIFLKKDDNSLICNGCGVCKSVCPSENALCIENLFDKIKINADYSHCISCGNCVDICPQKAVEFYSGNRLAKNDKNSLSEVFVWK